MLESSEASIRYKTVTGVLGEEATSRKVRVLQEQVRTSPRVKALRAHRDQRARWTMRDARMRWRFSRASVYPKMCIRDRD